MSRPPTMHVGTSEKAFNGGLIDFHENVLRADLSPYVMSSPAAMMYQPSQPQFVQTSQSYMNPQQYNSQPFMATQCIPGPQSFMPTQCIPGPQSFMPTQCIPGPPSFVHLNGQVYRPVGEELAPPDPPSSPVTTNVDIENEVNRRVQQKVDEAMNKLKPHSVSSSRSTSGKKDNKKDPLQALQRINSTMRQCVASR